jgi:hypothetical protein
MRNISDDEFLRVIDTIIDYGKILKRKIDNSYKTSFSIWLYALELNGIRPSIRLLNVLNSEIDDFSIYYIEDIEYNSFLKWRNCGKKTADEFFSLVKMSKEYKMV